MSGSDAPLTLRRKLLYAAGFVPDVVMSNVITSLALMIYKVELGVPASLIGLAISIPRLWEAFTDPLIGSWSDRCRSRWGRRRPFLLVGAVAAGLLCMALWSPPSGWGPNQLFWYFLITSVLYLTAYAAYNVPFQALGLEMASDDRNRASLAGFRAAANNFSWIAILPFLPLLVTNGWLGTTPIESVQKLGILIGVLVIALGVMTAMTCQDRPTIPEATKAATSPTPAVGAGILVALRDRAFLHVAGIMCFALIGFVLAMTLPYFVNLTIVFPGGTAEAKRSAAEMSTWSSVIGNILAMGFCPFIAPLAERFGRKQVLSAGLLVLMTSFLATPILFSHEWPWLQLLYKIIDTPAIAIVWVLTMPMLAEVCDRDAIIHGHARQGIFTAMFNWGNKASMALVAVLSGLVIDASGFDGKLTQQAPETATYFRWVFALAPLPFLAAALYLTQRFPLSSHVITALRQKSAASSTSVS